MSECRAGQGGYSEKHWTKLWKWVEDFPKIDKRGGPKLGPGCEHFPKIKKRPPPLFFWIQEYVLHLHVCGSLSLSQSCGSSWGILSYVELGGGYCQTISHTISSGVLADIARLISRPIRLCSYWERVTSQPPFA